MLRLVLVVVLFFGTVVEVMAENLLDGDTQVTVCKFDPTKGRPKLSIGIVTSVGEDGEPIVPAYVIGLWSSEKSDGRFLIFNSPPGAEVSCSEKTGIFIVIREHTIIGVVVPDDMSA